MRRFSRWLEQHPSTVTSSNSGPSRLATRQGCQLANQLSEPTASDARASGPEEDQGGAGLTERLTFLQSHLHVVGTENVGQGKTLLSRSMVGMLQFVPDINRPSLATPFYSVLASMSVFTALSTVFHSINSPDNSPFSDSVLLVLSLPHWSFQLYFCL